MVTATRPQRRARSTRPIWQERRLTLEEFLALPEQEPELEYEDGEVTQKVSPKARHSTLQGEFVEVINRRYRRRKVARAFPELRTTFGGQSFVPDVSVFRWERIARTQEGEPVDDVLVPPDIAIEIVSPKQSVNALVRRCIRYVTLGVQIAVLVDPDDHSVIRFTPGAVPVALRGSDTIDLSSVLPDLRLTVNDLFKSLLT